MCCNCKCIRKLNAPWFLDVCTGVTSLFLSTANDVPIFGKLSDPWFLYCMHMFLFVLWTRWSLAAEQILVYYVGGGAGDVWCPSLLETRGCHLIPLSYLLSCISAKSLIFLFCHFSAMVHSPDLFFSENLQSQTFFIKISKNWAFCIALVWPLGDDSWWTRWYVQLVAITFM